VDRLCVVVVIPARNESATIGTVVAGAWKHATVLVVDDCSDDETSAQAECAGAIVVHNPRQLGYVASLNRGVKEALRLGFHYIITMDADGEHSPEFLPEFASALAEQEVQIVLGVRTRKHRLIERVMGLYVRARFGPRDILCGMKGYRAELVRDNGGLGSGFVGTELALKSVAKGMKFAEVLVDGVRRSDTPRFGNSWRANVQILGAFCELLKKGRNIGR
jgi:glycosyltransferase involved in cell wall biosynthesis